MVNNHLVATLADFGISIMGGATSATQGTKAIGTFQYLAPEALKRNSPTQESDIWAFGCICVEVGSYSAVFIVYVFLIIE